MVTMIGVRSRPLFTSSLLTTPSTMMITKILLLVIFSLCNCATSEGGLTTYDNFRAWANKYLPNEEKPEQYYQQWMKNADYADYHNSQNYGYKLTLNQFAHFSAEEYYIRQNLSYFNNDDQFPLHQDMDWKEIPSSVDWREKGVITPVKNQGNCGSSDIIALVDAVSSFHAIESGQLVEYSVNQILACCNETNGCNGFPFVNFPSCIKRSGFCPTQFDPCNQHPASPCTVCHCNGPVFHVANLQKVPNGDEMALAAAVAKQPVIVFIDAGQTSFQLYHSGVYYSSLCSKTKVDHAMLLVGYGTTDDGQQYWLCKNSWGKEWGMEGYIMIARNKGNMCGIATYATFPV